MIIGRYAPGAQQAVVTDHGLVVLGAEVPLSLLERVWQQASAGRGLPAVLEALTGAFGTSLAAIPPFAVVLREGDGARIVVRGSLVISVESDSGAEELSGAGVTTWTERSVSGVQRATIVAAEPSAPAEYPVRDGIVLVSTIGVDFSGAVDAADVAAPPVAAPPVAPAPALVEGAAAPAPAAVAAPPVVERGPEAGGETPGPSNDADQPVEAPAPAEEADVSSRSARSTTGDEAAAAATPPVVPEVVVEEPEPAAAVDAPPPGLIDSTAVLTMTGVDTLLPGESTFARTHTQEPAGAPTPDPDPEWAATIARAAAPTPTAAGDHDGETISLAEARRLRGVDSDSAPPPLAPPRPPAPGRVRLSTGQVLLLDRTVVIGRRPRSTRVVGTDLPHLVAVDSPEQDISRSHVELRVEGDSVVATDLHTTNGTTLHRAGADPVRLHPGEATVVVPGDLLDLGDGVTVTIEDLA